jgi:small subunit ribosomal protein S20
MPIIKSAQKKLRQDKGRTARNEITKKAYKAAIKTVSKLSEAAKKIAPANVSAAYKKIDKATKKHLLHPNKAARLKSRVSKLARGTK